MSTRMVALCCHTQIARMSLLVRSSSAVWTQDVIELTSKFVDPLCFEGRGSCSWRIRRSGLRSSGKRFIKAYVLSQIVRYRT